MKFTLDSHLMLECALLGRTGMWMSMQHTWLFWTRSRM